MPKIRIHETDTTGISVPSIPNIVYIPGNAVKDVAPVLYTNARAFEKAFKENDNLIVDDSANLAHHLLTLGMSVLYEGFAASESAEGKEVKVTYAMTADGDELKFAISGIEYTINAARSEVSYTVESEEEESGEQTVTAVISATAGVYGATLADSLEVKFDFVDNNVIYTKTYDLSGKPSIDWKKLEDKAIYDVRFLTTGAFRCPSIDMIKCAAKRVDAVALIDCGDLEAESGAVSCRTWFDNFLSGIINVETGEYNSAILDEVASSTSDPLAFAAAFAPSWNGTIHGLEGDVAIENIPASFGYLIAFARSIQNNPIWYAAAGSFRGLIPELESVAYEYTTADIEILQARAKDVEVALDGEGDNVGYAINPIALVRPFGHIVWGNRTLRFNEEVDEVGVLKATSFLNCRVLATEVAKAIYNAARKYTFEQNSVVLWANFRSEITPLLDRMESGNGVLGYTLKRVATNKRARLAAKVTLIPIEGVEDFDVEIEMADNIAVSE